MKNNELIRPKGAKIRRVALARVVEGFCKNNTASETSKWAGVSRQTVASYYRELMRRLVDDQIVNGGVWGEVRIEGPDSPIWRELFRCIYECPADWDLNEIRTRAMRSYQTRAASRRLSIGDRVPCQQNCRWKLSSDTFSDAHYRRFMELRWRNRTLTAERFRDIYFTTIFRINYMDSGVFLRGQKPDDKVSAETLASRFFESFRADSRTMVR